MTKKEKNIKTEEKKNKKINSKKDIEKKFLLPKSDIVFQSLFGKNNLEITKAFIESILEEKVESMKINEDKELIRRKPEEKLGILDLQLEINNKEKVDVEIQLCKRKDFVERILYYLARLYVDQIKRGKKYNEVKRVVMVAIVDFEIEEMKEIKGMESRWKIIETKNREKILTEKVEIIIIQIKKAKEEYVKNKKNEKAQWILFLDNPESEEVKEIVKSNEKIREAKLTVHKMTEEEMEERLEFLKEKARLDEVAIREAGYDDGKTETSIKIAKKLIKEGKKIEYICDLTELSKEEIKKYILQKI